MGRPVVVQLHVIASSDTELDCIVCRRRRVDREIVYGIIGGRASQGLHARCQGRLQAVRPGRGIRRRRPAPSESADAGERNKGGA